MLLKKALLMGTATLFTVSAVKFSTRLYAEVPKSDSTKSAVMDVNTNSAIHSSLAKSLEEDEALFVAQADIDAAGEKITPTLPEASTSIEAEVPETAASEDTGKTTSHADTPSGSQMDKTAKTDDKTEDENNNNTLNSQTETSDNNKAADASTGSSSKSAASSNAGSPSPASAQSSSTGASAKSPEAANAGAEANSLPTTNPSASNAQNNDKYKHTTSIYSNDESTLLRVEYYDTNDKLCEYSSVSNYDKETNSYTETVYQYDNENQVEVTVRTDTYVNGELASSETP